MTHECAIFWWSLMIMAAPIVLALLAYAGKKAHMEIRRIRTYLKYRKTRRVQNYLRGPF